MNRDDFDKLERLRKFAEILVDILRVDCQNREVDEMLKTGKEAPEKEIPRYKIHNLMILAQVTDYETLLPWEQETFKILEGGPIEVNPDGKINHIINEEVGGAMIW